MLSAAEAEGVELLHVTYDSGWGFPSGVSIIRDGVSSYGILEILLGQFSLLE